MYVDVAECSAEILLTQPKSCVSFKFSFAFLVFQSFVSIILERQTAYA